MVNIMLHIIWHTVSSTTHTKESSLHLRRVGSHSAEKPPFQNLRIRTQRVQTQQKSTANQRVGKEKEGNPHMAGKYVG